MNIAPSSVKENSNIGVMLKEIAEECPDIVTWI